MTETFTPPLAALTTVFTPPCTTTWLLTSTKLPSQFPPFPTAAPATTCDPPQWNSYLTSRGFEYYSPAICPDGFAVGPSCIITSARTAQGFPAVQNGETAAYCVPLGHTCTSDTSDFRGGVWGVSRTASDAAATVTVGPAIQIRWQESDLANLETDPLTPGLVLSSNVAPAVVAPTTVETTTADPPPTVTIEISSSSSTSSSSSISSSSSLNFHQVLTSSTSSTLSTTIPNPQVPSGFSSSVLTPIQSGLSSSQTSQEDQTSSSSILVAPSPSAAGSGASPSSSDADGQNSESSQYFLMVAIVLTTILLALASLYMGWSLLRRYRRRQRERAAASLGESLHRHNDNSHSHCHSRSPSHVSHGGCGVDDENDRPPPPPPKVSTGDWNPLYSSPPRGSSSSPLRAIGLLSLAALAIVPSAINWMRQKTLASLPSPTTLTSSHINNNNYPSSPSSSRSIQQEQHQRPPPDAELDADSPLSELGAADPIGTLGNPAELAVGSRRNSAKTALTRRERSRSRSRLTRSSFASTASSTSSLDTIAVEKERELEREKIKERERERNREMRWSWMSRVSRMFTVRPRGSGTVRSSV